MTVFIVLNSNRRTANSPAPSLSIRAEWKKESCSSHHSLHGWEQCCQLHHLTTGPWRFHLIWNTHQRTNISHPCLWTEATVLVLSSHHKPQNTLSFNHGDQLEQRYFALKPCQEVVQSLSILFCWNIQSYSSCIYLFFSYMFLSMYL